MPEPSPEFLRRIRRTAAVLAVMVLIAALVKSIDWQNSIRRVWGLPDLDPISPFTAAFLALAVFACLILIGRLFAMTTRTAYRRLGRYVPPRIAALGALLAAGIAFFSVASGVLFDGGLRLADSAARKADAFIAPDQPPPSQSDRTGSAASLIGWTDLGRWGRRFVTSGPTDTEIAAFWEDAAKRPLRVYVGLTAAGTPRQRAELAFQELKRVGGFDRKILVIAVPTGSGWLDPAAHDPLEVMHKGDIATVAVQYSYLPSWISLLTDPTYGIEESQALFDLVYRHWTTLPKESRPKLYLHGLSLGAFLSQSTVPLLDVLGDPFDGAMWAGSPFVSEFWGFVIARRQADSPAWRPRFGNGSLIRTTNQQNVLGEAAADWGPIRLVFLQYASDPIVFFDSSLAFRQPDWLRDERGPDVSPLMRWIPVVTLLQVGLDMGVSLGTPGFGHDYISPHYIPAWVALTDPEGWTPELESKLVAAYAIQKPR